MKDPLRRKVLEFVADSFCHVRDETVTGGDKMEEMTKQLKMRLTEEEGSTWQIVSCPSGLGCEAIPSATPDTFLALDLPSAWSSVLAKGQGEVWDSAPGLRLFLWQADCPPPPSFTRTFLLNRAFWYFIALALFLLFLVVRNFGPGLCLEARDELLPQRIPHYMDRWLQSLLPTTSSSSNCLDAQNYLDYIDSYSFIIYAAFVALIIPAALRLAKNVFGLQLGQ